MPIVNMMKDDKGVLTSWHVVNSIITNFDGNVHTEVCSYVSSQYYLEEKQALENGENLDRVVHRQVFTIKDNVAPTIENIERALLQLDEFKKGTRRVKQGDEYIQVE